MVCHLSSVPLPTLRLLLLMVNHYNGQLSFGEESLFFGLVLWYLPQSHLIHPEEGTIKHGQAECSSPAEEPSEGVTAAPVSLHRLYRLNQVHSDTLIQT